MTDYTDLKARLRACANGFGSFKTNAGDFGLCDDAAAAITALEDDIARLQTAHVQMQRAHDDLAAENARLRGADAVLGAVWEYGMTTLHPHPPEWPMVLNRVRNYFVERDDAGFDARAALTAPTSD